MPRSSAAASTASSPFDPPGMDHGGAAGVGRDLERVGEREERVARNHGTLRTLAGLAGRDPRRVDARHLPRTDTDGRALPHEHDRVRLHAPRDRPRELEVGPLLSRGLPAPARPSSLPGVSVTRSRSCTSAPPGSGRTSRPDPSGSGASTTRRFVRSANARRASAVNDGAITTSVNTSRHRCRGVDVGLTVERHDAAERAHLVAGERRPVGIGVATPRPRPRTGCCASRSQPNPRASPRRARTAA